MEGLPIGYEIRVFPDPDALAAGATDFVVSTLLSVAGPRVVLAGGSTPIALYDRLSATALRRRVRWDRVRFALADERAVPPDHPDSNYAMVRKYLLGPVGASEDRVVRLHGEEPPEHAAAKAHRSLWPWTQRIPIFDLVLLGVGQDGHVASLFPADEWPDHGTRLAAPARHPDGGDRITLTPAALRSTSCICFLVSGQEKAGAVRDAITIQEISPRFPARMVTPAGGSVVWLLDAPAASLLPEPWRDGVSVTEESE